MQDLTDQSINSVIEALVKKEASVFRKMIMRELATRIHTKLEGLKKTLSSELLANAQDEVNEDMPIAPSGPPMSSPMTKNPMTPGVVPTDAMPQKEPIPFKLPKVKASELRIVPTTAGSVRDDATLDPAVEKEFFLRSENYKNQEITIKQVGTGLGKPVRVYINGRRWEFFPGPKVAMSATKEYVDQLVKDARKDPELAIIMTQQIKNDKKSGVASVPAPVDAGKPNEMADADLKRKQMGGAYVPSVPKPKDPAAAPPTPPAGKAPPKKK
jgi:hypothetical protein